MFQSRNKARILLLHSSKCLVKMCLKLRQEQYGSLELTLSFKLEIVLCSLKLAKFNLDRLLKVKLKRSSCTFLLHSISMSESDLEFKAHGES